MAPSVAPSWTISARRPLAAGFGLVNVRHAEIAGMPAVRSLDDLSFVPELVVISAPVRRFLGLSSKPASAAQLAPLIVTAGLGHGQGSLQEAALAAARLATACV